jgi:hypothetical protein
MLLKLLTKYNSISCKLRNVSRYALTLLVGTLTFVPAYYRFNDLMWQDGLLIDFLQKKILSKWVQGFLIHSSYLFNERVLFEFVARFYVDFVVWPLTVSSVFEFSDVSSTLTGLIAAVVAVTLLFNLNYLYVLCL